VANVVARSAFVNQVDEGACIACGLCVESCPFDALGVEDTAQVDRVRCVGCGVCALVCPEGALSLVRRPESEVLPPPVTERDWMAERAAARGIALDDVL
jgi:heterodisulfide reductase subunit A-like polyferredoxin